MKIIFMGTPEFSCLPLDALYNAGHEICAVVCQQDKVNSRGNKIVLNPTKKWALEHGIKCLQYKSIKKEGIADLLNLNADLIVTCAYGQILNEDVLNSTKYGVFNIHSSILPKYRGASPIISALLNGDKVTGVSIMKTNIGMDDGDVLLSEEIAIEENDNSISLSNKLSTIGAKLICEVVGNLPYYLEHKVAQKHENATYCTKVDKEMAHINFMEDATIIVNKIKAYALNPTAFFVCNGLRYKVYNAIVCDADAKNTQVGCVVCCDNKNGLIIKAKNGTVKILTIQAPNGKILDVKSFVNGNKLEIGGKCE